MLFAIVAIPIVLFIVLFKPLGFYALTIMLAGLTVWEYYGLAKVKGYSPQVPFGIVITMCIASLFGQLRMKFYLGWDFDFVIGIAVALIILSSFLILAIELFRNKPNPIAQTAITLFGAAYIGIGCGSVFGVYDSLRYWASARGGYNSLIGGYFVLTVLVSIWICDSAAYFIGRAFGKHKFFERISPKKTWEGAIAGFLASIIIWIVLPKVIPALGFISIVNAMVIGFIVGSIGQIGDLGKSLLKRDAGVKDSSNLIPGHGGVLDRLDSILFVFPVLLILLYVLHYFEILGV
ncbi:MAG TPA: phosphatidate cytidylyltransferase [Candidatus Kapabacteria bacterium]|nr:phosphatidate cytidylyltransferase [Candidatus Kapabacteria bacterium]